MKLVGLLAYNGIYFNGSSQVTLQSEAVRDEADRTTIYVRHTLTVKAVLYDTADTGGDMYLARYALEQQGGPLMFVGQGAGTFYINSPGGMPDIKGGPRTRVLAWGPIGSLRACEVVWTCEFCLPYLETLTAANRGYFTAFDYSIAYSIDARGSTTRTISGYYEVPQQRTASVGGVISRTLIDTADTYRYAVNPPIPDEFQRAQQDFRLSADKCRMDFTIVDSEIPSDNAYPEGIARIDARHAVSWVRGSSGTGFIRNRLTVDIELAFDQPIENAYSIFLLIANERINKAKSNSKHVLLESVNAEEGLFDRRVSMSVTWRFTYATPTTIFQNLPAISGLFDPVNPTGWTWAKWKTSVANANDTGGYQHIKSGAANDRIIDLQTKLTMPWGHTVSKDPGAAATVYAGLSNYALPDAYSWLEYNAWVEIMRDQPVSRQSVLQSAPAAEASATQDVAGLPTYPTASGTDDIIQTSGNPRYWAIVRGTAKRAKEIPRPIYTTIGNATATEKKSRFVQRVVGQCLGLTIFQACWEIVYELDKSPGTVPNLINLAEGVVNPTP
jgi:hypothetical protein